MGVRSCLRRFRPQSDTGVWRLWARAKLSSLPETVFDLSRDVYHTDNRIPKVRLLGREKNQRGRHHIRVSLSPASATSAVLAELGGVLSRKPLICPLSFPIVETSEGGYH